MSGAAEICFQVCETLKPGLWHPLSSFDSHSGPAGEAEQMDVFSPGNSSTGFSTVKNRPYHHFQGISRACKDRHQSLVDQPCNTVMIGVALWAKPLAFRLRIRRGKGRRRVPIFLSVPTLPLSTSNPPHSSPPLATLIHSSIHSLLVSTTLCPILT